MPAVADEALLADALDAERGLGHERGSAVARLEIAHELGDAVRIAELIGAGRGRERPAPLESIFRRHGLTCVVERAAHADRTGVGNPLDVDAPADELFDVLRLAAGIVVPHRVERRKERQSLGRAARLGVAHESVVGGRHEARIALGARAVNEGARTPTMLLTALARLAAHYTPHRVARRTEPA